MSPRSQANDAPSGLARRRTRMAASRLFAAIAMYRRDNVEQWSLRVVNRGLFLAVSVMILLLFVLEWVTSQLPGVNEIVIPTIAVPSSVDLGAIIHDTLLRQRGVLLDAAGVATLIFSAIYTGRSLRNGLRNVALGSAAPRVRWREATNVVVAMGLIALLLAGWLLTLTTVVRTRAINVLLATDLPRIVVNIGKGLAVILVIVIFALSAAVAFRRLFPSAPRTDAVAAGLGVGLFVAAANFVLFYAYIAALTSPNASGGVVLVFMIMAWVNAVARVLLLACCWVSVAASPSAVPSSASTPVSGPVSGRT